MRLGDKTFLATPAGKGMVVDEVEEMDVQPCMSFQNLLWEAPRLLLRYAGCLGRWCDAIREDPTASTKYLPRAFSLLPMNKLQPAFVGVSVTMLADGGGWEQYEKLTRCEACDFGLLARAASCDAR